jgi:aryl carrier-like protein
VSIKTTILSEIHGLAAAEGKTLRPLTDELVLLEAGLDSLMIAILIAALRTRWAWIRLAILMTYTIPSLWATSLRRMNDLASSTDSLYDSRQVFSNRSVES